MGSLGMSLMFNATSLLMLRYLVDYAGIGAALAGLLIGGAKIYDAVGDRLIVEKYPRRRHGFPRQMYSKS